MSMDFDQGSTTEHAPQPPTVHYGTLDFPALGFQMAVEFSPPL